MSITFDDDEVKLKAAIERLLKAHDTILHDPLGGYIDCHWPPEACETEWCDTPWDEELYEAIEALREFR